MEESIGQLERAREVYERAIANVPPLKEKRYWRRYVFLWLNYAVFEELEAKVCAFWPTVGSNFSDRARLAQDVARARSVYSKCLQIIPHELFTFAKVWLAAATFEIRQHNVDQARKLLGTAVGKCPKEKIFKGYIELEVQVICCSNSIHPDNGISVS